MLKQFTREEKSWIFYDWANSAQSAIVAAIILPIFFKSMARAGGVSDVDATAYWGYATSLGTLICALLAPLLGADVLAEISSVGSLLILAISLNMLGVTKIRVMNLVPAMVFPVVLCTLI